MRCNFNISRIKIISINDFFFFFPSRIFFIFNVEQIILNVFKNYHRSRIFTRKIEISFSQLHVMIEEPQKSPNLRLSLIIIFKWRDIWKYSRNSSSKFSQEEQINNVGTKVSKKFHPHRIMITIPVSPYIPYTPRV